MTQVEKPWVALAFGRVVVELPYVRGRGPPAPDPRRAVGEKAVVAHSSGHQLGIDVIGRRPPEIEIVELGPVIRRRSHFVQPVLVRAAPVRALEELVLVRPGHPVVTVDVIVQQVFRHGLVQPVEVHAAGDGSELDEVPLERAQHIGRLVGRAMVPDDDVVALLAQVTDGLLHEVPVVVTKEHAEQAGHGRRAPAPVAARAVPPRPASLGCLGHLRSQAIFR